MSDVTVTESIGQDYQVLPLARLSIEIARSVSKLGRICVEGEVKEPKVLQSGQVFFSLIDRGCTLSCSIASQRSVSISLGRDNQPASQGPSTRSIPVVNGDRVQVYGTLAYKKQYGQLRLEVVDVVPVGVGDIDRAIEEIRRRLQADGLITRPRKPIPRLPRKIGVITGSEAAVIGDIRSVISERFPGYPVKFKAVTVSGPGAPAAIVGALGDLEKDHDVDVVIVARGGGEPSTLFPFSSEELCRALCSVRFPVVTAVGHEKDHPLCDEVSDLACNTPSLAAIRVIPSRADLVSELDFLVDQARDVLVRGLGQELTRLGSIDLLGSLYVTFESRQRELASIDLSGPLTYRVSKELANLDGMKKLADELDPHRVLERGYAVVITADRVALRDPNQVSPGDQVDIQVSRGTFKAQVVGQRRLTQPLKSGNQ